MPPEQCHTQPTIELLSPAGNRECLEAAVQNGTDAVYLGIKEFNARVFARNFTLEELAQEIKYCHRHGVKLYLTLNTLVKNHEIGRFFNVLSRAYTLGIDGVIIQHLSFLSIIQQNFPDLSVFISTQGAIGNAASASLLKSADRIILPRELTLAEIKKITEAGIKVEVFVHGALCYSYSGLCLFSSFVSSRSGNRGSCAQLCRQRYNGTYPLSTRELCLARRIPDLIRAGVSGFKIEGRMRSPLYVAVATRLYRKAIDSFQSGDFRIPEKEMAEIEVVFNREFTEGFIGGETNLTSPEKPMNRGAFLGIAEDGELSLSRSLSTGDGIGIWQDKAVTGAIIKEITVAGKRVKTAQAGQKVRTGIEIKDGAKVYLTSSPRITIEPDFVLQKAPLAIPVRKKVKITLPDIKPVKSDGLKLMVKAYSLPEAVSASQSGADIVFYNIFADDFPGKHDWREKAILGAYLPRIMNDEELASASDILSKQKPGAVLAGNIGFLTKLPRLNMPVYLDYSPNAFNDLDLLFFKSYGAIPIISPELSLKELTELQDKDVAVFCHGDVVLVNTRINPDTKELRDEKGATFRVRAENSYWQILNSRPFGLFGDIQKLRDCGIAQFLIDHENRGATTVKLYRQILDGGTINRKARQGYTAGHLYKPVQ